MSKRPETSPLSLTVPLRIPAWWTAEQAFAVFEIVNDLRDAIWLRYQMQLIDEYRAQCKEAPDICIENTDDSAF